MRLRFQRERESARKREPVYESVSASAANSLKVSLKSYITMKNASVLSALAVAVAVAFAFVGALSLCVFAFIGSFQGNYRQWLWLL